ncbi:hypothetical protein [Aurantiacibacter gangjinensis]|uniref:Uncharacterized protein n=1 Tax=Aurantiacibacter gangjinensis TaxID=502682 RepID=A0A0G9MML6_9SPHN|nr:hypothetical protein [Aurantiacibacter gangjinensis]KLE31981.1 hypothetical protein AAW01_11140 [Aurantiacibacter gangjinensis]
MLEYRMTSTDNWNGAIGQSLVEGTPEQLKEALHSVEAFASSEVPVELLHDGRSFASCVTIAAEVLAWRTDRSALRRPTIGVNTYLEEIPLTSGRR